MRWSLFSPRLFACCSGSCSLCKYLIGYLWRSMGVQCFSLHPHREFLRTLMSVSFRVFVSEALCCSVRRTSPLWCSAFGCCSARGVLCARRDRVRRHLHGSGNTQCMFALRTSTCCMGDDVIICLSARDPAGLSYCVHGGGVCVRYWEKGSANGRGYACTPNSLSKIKL